jgi:dienelactone hydrolase
MRAAWKALNVMWTLHSELASGEKSARAELINLDDASIDSRSVNVDVYEPHIKAKGTIVVFHGMSPFGKNDPRIVCFCQALCQVGFRVISPDIQSIRDLKIEAQQIKLVADILNSITRKSSLSSTGKVSVLAPSFSGAMCLAAAADERIKDRIISICAIGAFTEVDSVMNFLLTDDRADPYGQYIVLKKIIPMVMESKINENCLVIQQALDAAIQDNINETSLLDVEMKAVPGSSIALGQCIGDMSANEVELIRRVLEDASYREHLFSKAKRPLSDELEALDIVSQIDELSAKVLLLHGKQDNVIPSSQSELLYQKLKSKKKDVDLVVTPFISHGDTSFSLRQLPDVWRIVKGFSFFFEDHMTFQG